MVGRKEASAMSILESLINGRVLNPWTYENRELVRLEKSNGCLYLLDSTQKYIGHVYDDNGRYRTYYLKPGIDNIARFVCSGPQDKFLTSSDDKAVMTIIDNFIDLDCIEDADREILLRLIEKYQNTNARFECYH